MEEKFIALKEIAERLNVSRWKVDRLIEEKELPAYRFGAAWRVKEADLEEYIQNSKAN
jgi:excisionase family DNA binding protein